MNFQILTLFPEMVEQGLNTSILGRALENEFISIEAVNIRDYTLDKHKKVDDYPYGGGAGMLMQAQPISDAYEAVVKKIKNKKRPRVLYMTPQGTTFTQGMAEELAEEEDLIFLCGHYEGVDERVLEEIVTDYVSIGDFVLTGGELPAMVMIDAIARLVPGVLNNEDSSEFESFHNNLLEYPQYSRPEVWHDKKVPGVLLSGNHKEIMKWRLEQSKERTKKRRPDLYIKYEEVQLAIERLMKNKLIHMCMIETLRKGGANLLYSGAEGVVLQDKASKVYMVSAFSVDAGTHLLSFLPKDTDMVITHQEFLNELVINRFEMTHTQPCYQAVYTRGVTLPVDRKIEIKPLDMKCFQVICEQYHFMDDPSYIEERIEKGCFYGAFLEGELAGFMGMHAEGSMGMLEVLPKYRKRGVAMALEADYINRLLQIDRIPFGQIVEGNEASMKLQEKLGLRISKEKLYWLTK